MGFLYTVAALWIVSRTAIAIPVDARHAIDQRGEDRHPVAPKVFIIDMVSWIKFKLGSHEFLTMHSMDLKGISGTGSRNSTFWHATSLCLDFLLSIQVFTAPAMVTSAKL